MQVPHWKHVLSVSPPCSLRTSYLNVGSSLCGGGLCSVDAVACAMVAHLREDLNGTRCIINLIFLISLENNRAH